MANGTTSLEIPFTGTITLSENNGVVSFAVNANGATTAPVRPTGTTTVTSTPTASTVAPRPPAPSGVFNVTNYGAVGDGVADDTAAINAALDAAGAAASSGNRQTVYLPAGTYKVIPTGTIRMRIHTKASGSWSLTSDDPSDTLVGGFHVYDVAPTAGVGTDGQRYINRKENKVYLKTAGTWAQESILFDGSGTGWTAGYLAPDNADGVDGDVYIQYYLTATEPFKVQQKWNHVTLKGAGKTLTKLLYRCWGDISPDDYTIVGGVVTATQIPPSSLYTTSSRTSRTEFFRWRSDGTHAVTPLAGFYIQDLELDGNTTVDNLQHGYGTFANELDQWDLSQKGCTFSYGADGNILDVKIQRVNAHNVRGEIFYAGGNTSKSILLEDCTISNSKGSAVSISGSVTMTGCDVSYVYNGVENQMVNDQFLSIDDCTFTMTGGGVNGVVPIVSENTCSFTMTNSTVIGAQDAGIYVADQGYNVTITGNTLRDCKWAIRFGYNAGIYGDVAYDEILVQNNTFEAVTKNNEFCVEIDKSTGAGIFTNCLIDGNTVTGVGSFRYSEFLRTEFYGLPASYGVTLSNNTISSANTVLIRAWEATYPTAYPLPVVAASNTGYARARKDATGWFGTPSTVYPENPWHAIDHYTNGASVGIGNLSRYPAGNIYVIDNAASSNSVVFPADPAWNTFSTDQTLTPGSSLTIVKNVSGTFDLVP